MPKKAENHIQNRAPGPADADGAGDAQDVARPYPHRSREQEGGQGGDARLSLLGFQDVEAVLEFPHLDEAQLAGEEDAGADQKDDGQAEVPQDGDVSVSSQSWSENSKTG